MKGRIDYRTTPPSVAAKLMVKRHGAKAAEVARNREDAANTEEGAAFWQRVGIAIDSVHSESTRSVVRA